MYLKGNIHGSTNSGGGVGGVIPPAFGRLVGKYKICKKSFFRKFIENV